MIKTRDKQGAVALEAVIALSLILPILFSFVFGGYDFYLRQADNVNLNFEAGRYMSTMTECSNDAFRTMSDTFKFNKYDLIAHIDGTRHVVYSAPVRQGSIVVHCGRAA